MSNSRLIGTPFFRENNTILAKDLKLLGTVGDSVGLIVIERLEDGQVLLDIATGFLVGDGYFMTAYHVFENKINAILENIDRFMPDDERRKKWIQAHFPEEPDQSLLSALIKHVEREQFVLFEDFTLEMDPQDREQFNTKLKNKWDQCHAAFWKSNATDDSREEMTFFFSQYIPFADKENDVIILKISADSHHSLPKGLILHEEYEKRDKLSLYGYLKHDGCEELHLDPQCLIYTDPSTLDKDIENAKQWWQEKEKETACDTYMKIDFDEEFGKCSASYNKDNGCFTMHASDKFVHGTSGSPLVFIKRVGNERRPVVTGMYQRGFPAFYYTLQNSMKTHELLPTCMAHYNKFRHLLHMNEHVPLKHFFEAGVTMERVAEVLGKSEKRSLQLLKKAIFNTEGSQGNPVSSTTIEDTSTTKTLQESEDDDELRRNGINPSKLSLQIPASLTDTSDNEYGGSNESRQLNWEEISVTRMPKEMNNDEERIPLEVIVKVAGEEESNTVTSDIHKNKAFNLEEDSDTEYESDDTSHRRSFEGSENYMKNSDETRNFKDRETVVLQAKKLHTSILDDTGHSRSLEVSENYMDISNKTRDSKHRKNVLKQRRIFMARFRVYRICKTSTKTLEVSSCFRLFVHLACLIFAVAWIVTYNKISTTMTGEVETVLHNHRFNLFHTKHIFTGINYLDLKYKDPAIVLIITAITGCVPLINVRLLFAKMTVILMVPVVFFVVFNIGNQGLIGNIRMIANDDALEQYRNNDTTKATFNRFMEMFVCCGISNKNRNAEYVSDGCCSTQKKQAIITLKLYSCCYIKAKEFHDTNQIQGNIVAAVIMFAQLIATISEIYLKRQELFNERSSKDLI